MGISKEEDAGRLPAAPSGDKAPERKKSEGKARRQLTGPWAVAATVVAVAASCFGLYTATFGVLYSIYQRAIHYVLMATLIFLLYPVVKKRNDNKVSALDVLFIAMVFASGIYLIASFQAIAQRAGNPTGWDVFFGILMILCVLEAARRIAGTALTVVAACALLYAYLGPYLPAVIGHRGYSVARIVSQSYLFTDGIFGTPLGMSATYVFLFVLFGAFLEKTGAGQTFIDLANLVAGRSRGGAGKTAVTASALFGMISGSVTANVATCGTFTIPLMKKAGYKNWFAGAVEAVASTGGQIMPPVMGSSAFIMAEYLGIPYIQIAKAAAIPAILYFVAVFLMVDREAGRLGLKKMTAAELPDVKATLKKAVLALIPIIGLLVALISGKTPMLAGLVGIVLCTVVGFLKPEGRLRLRDLIPILDKGARSALTVAAATACAGIVIGSVNLTGLGLAFSSMVVNLAGGRLLIALLLTMTASLILGMGLTTTACYVLLAVLAAPAIIQMGVPPLAAHMFVFFFGTISFITPPVALGAYAAAGIAESDSFKTGWAAFRLGIASFIVPFAVCYSPELLMKGSLPNIVFAIVTALIGIFALSDAVIGWDRGLLHPIARAILFIGGVMMIFPGIVISLAGLGLVIAASLLGRYLGKQPGAPIPAAGA